MPTNSNKLPDFLFIISLSSIESLVSFGSLKLRSGGETHFTKTQTYCALKLAVVFSFSNLTERLDAEDSERSNKLSDISVLSLS
jgi:hypothetical protein